MNMGGNTRKFLKFTPATLYQANMKAKIYKPAKTAMQSGVAKTKYWLLEYVPESKKYVEPLMGWTGSEDTQAQVKLRFPTMEKAVAYANSNNIPYEVMEVHPRKKIRKSYADNFAYKPPVAE